MRTGEVMVSLDENAVRKIIGWSVIISGWMSGLIAHVWSQQAIAAWL